ncbi:hypothetical protein FBU30_003490 [Linnemannia zychae]|nr:hypothetical protein FBU30_003490 [Linnemannia zychae]
MPSNLIPQPVIYESFVWSTLRKSFLLYGGKSLDGTTGNPRLTEFNANTQWSAVETTGTSPGDVSGHCMVPAYEGRKMVVFGGAGLDNIAKDSIYILDLVTQVWTPGNGAGPEQARTNMACVVSGDSFIAWGGESGGKVKDGKPIVYDMKNKQWTQEFKRSIVQTTPTGPNTTNEPKPSSGPSNTAAIAGGIAGGLALAGIPKPGPQDTSHWTQPRPFSQNLDRSQYVNRNHYQGVNTYDRNDLSGPQDTTHWMQPHPLSQNLGHDQYVSQNIYQDVNAYDRSDRGRNPQEDEALMRSYIPS